MVKTAIIYDVDKDEIFSIDVEHFFADSRIKDASRDYIFTLYQSTRVYESTINSMLKLVNAGAITLDQEVFTTEYSEGIAKGIEILEVMTRDMFGKETAELLIGELNKIVAADDEELSLFLDTDEDET